MLNLKKIQLKNYVFPIFLLMCCILENAVFIYSHVNIKQNHRSDFILVFSLSGFDLITKIVETLTHTHTPVVAF